MPELAVALDFPDSGPALEFSRRIKGLAPWVKVGLELFTTWGPDAVKELKALGYKVFLDLKYFDIPNTVLGAVRAASATGCDMLTLHAMGGVRMMAAAVKGAREARPDDPPLLLGVTVLTSMGPEDLACMAKASIRDMVADLSLRARSAGMDGVVCSPHEAAMIKADCGRDFLCVTPGIRLEKAGDDQRRTATPREAVQAGADLLVVGRPITASASPREVIRKILEQMV